MEASTATILTHPAGESATSPSFPSGSWPVDTPGGRFHAEWDDQAPVTREGQLIFFFQFKDLVQPRFRHLRCLKVSEAWLFKALLPAAAAPPMMTPRKGEH